MKTSWGALTELQRAAFSAFVWTAVFILFHVYWFCGGKFGFGDQSETLPEINTPAGITYGAVVGVMFLVGLLLPVAITQPWGRRIPVWLVLTCLWIGTVLLVLRGASGLVDTALRQTGIAPLGLTGMTYKEITGDDQVTLYTVLSGTGIDLYFTLGGIIYGLTTLRYRRVVSVQRAAAR